MTAPAAPLQPHASIDLDALCANYRMLKGAAQRAAVAPVVKCDAYGLGAGPVARELATREGARVFFVTYPEEGAKLRAALVRAAPQAEIFVFNGPDAQSGDLFAAHRLTPILNSLAQAKYWADRAPFSPAGLHLDSGMNRLGAPLAEAPEIARLSIDFALVMSHLSCSSEPAHPQNAAQLEAFRKAASIFRGVPLSIAASGGALIGPEFHLDLVRPGAALFGVSPFDVPHPQIAPVVTLQAPVLQLREARAGSAAGYGGLRRFDRTARLATVALGYGDGFPRAGSDRATAHLGGAPCRIAGRVSMDLIILDVTDAPQAVEIGEEAEFFGPRIAIEDAASACGTIGYELLTGLGARVRRRYVRGGREVDVEGQDA